MVLVSRWCCGSGRLKVTGKTRVKFVIGLVSFDLPIVSKIGLLEVRLVLVELSKSVRSLFVGFIYVVEAPVLVDI